MKPTTEDLSRVFIDWCNRFEDDNATPGMLARALNDLWDDAWEAEGEQREQTIAAFLSYGEHHADCPKGRWQGRCTCGYDSVREALSGNASVDSEVDRPTVDELVGVLAEASLADDLERLNREQRLRREAYEAALRESGDDQWVTPQARARRAAERYPLRKRVPRVIPDPHGAGTWKVFPPEKGTAEYEHVRFVDVEHGYRAYSAFPGLLWSADRIRALAALLDDPWTTEEDFSVEEAT